MATRLTGNLLCPLAIMDLPWSTTLVVIVLLLTTLAVILVALKGHGPDAALKLWGGIGTFVSAVLGALLGVSVGEGQAGAKVEAAQAEVRVQEARVASLDDRLRIEKRQREQVQGNLKTAELALLTAHLPEDQRPASLPMTYAFKAIYSKETGKALEAIRLDTVPKHDWVAYVNREDWKQVFDTRVRGPERPK